MRWSAIRSSPAASSPGEYLEVLDGQRSLFSAELIVAEARGNKYQSPVQLYRALGGGWQQLVQGFGVQY